MTLDSWLIARLARELEETLRGARIQSIHGSAAEFTLSCYRRGRLYALQVVLDQNAPIVAATANVEAQKEKGAGGWAGSVAALLRGCTVDAIQAVPNDRVIVVDVSSRSAFGVPSLTRLVLELQARKANVLVLRRGSDGTWLTVAAAKQFAAPAIPLNTRTKAAARNVAIGAPYILPPPRMSRLDRPQFIILCDKGGADDRDTLARLLGDYDPACTPPLAREVVHRVFSSMHPAPSARRLLSTWRAVQAEVAAAAENDGPVYVYQHDRKIVACHLIALTWPLLDPDKIADVNTLCRRAIENRTSVRLEPDLEALRKRLMTMLSRCEKEVAALQRARLKADEADELRRSGEMIYANLALIPEGASEYVADDCSVALDPRLSAKQNAAQYFKRYKKARSGLPQIAARLRELHANREYWEQLLWELERARDLAPVERRAAAAEIKAAAGLKERKPGAARKAKREELRIELSEGALALVGRSPKENERLTFTIASPHDYWFHARGIPGAHVIVKTNGAKITDDQIQAAAELAAGQSRGANSLAVEVDYTQRKHVRRQSAARPGLVWYDSFKTIRVSPKSLRRG